MPLAIDIGHRHLVVEVLLIIAVRAHAREFGFGLVGVALSQIRVGQTNGHHFVARAQVLRPGVIARRQVEVVHVEEGVGCFDQVVGGWWGRLANSCFGKCQADLLLGIVPLAFVGE